MFRSDGQPDGRHAEAHDRTREWIAQRESQDATQYRSDGGVQDGASEWNMPEQQPAHQGRDDRADRRTDGAAEQPEAGAQEIEPGRPR